MKNLKLLFLSLFLSTTTFAQNFESVREQFKKGGQTDLTLSDSPHFYDCITYSKIEGKPEYFTVIFGLTAWTQGGLRILRSLSLKHLEDIDVTLDDWEKFQFQSFALLPKSDENHTNFSYFFINKNTVVRASEDNDHDILIEHLFEKDTSSYEASFAKKIEEKYDQFPAPIFASKMLPNSPEYRAGEYTICTPGLGALR